MENKAKRKINQSTTTQTEKSYENGSKTQNKYINKVDMKNWALVDKDGKIHETFTHSTTARSWKWKLQKQQLRKLEIKKLPLI